MAMRFLALVIALLAASGAHAQRTNSAVTFGNTDAELCYRAAEMSRAPAGSLEHCDAALRDRSLPKKQRVATLINRGVVFNHRGNYPAAIADFEAALALDPQASAAYVNRGNTYFYSRQLDLAIEDYSTSLQLNPRNPHLAHFNRGLVNEVKQEEKLAYADFVRATELRPNWAPAVTRVQQYREKGFGESDQ